MQTHIELVSQETQGLAGCRYITPELVMDLYRFFLYIVNLFDDQGWVYRGHSLREGTELTLLVVKGTVNGAAVVCFVNARTTAACVRTFLRQMDEGTVGWRTDKFG